METRASDTTIALERWECRTRPWLTGVASLLDISGQIITDRYLRRTPTSSLRELTHTDTAALERRASVIQALGHGQRTGMLVMTTLVALGLTLVFTSGELGEAMGTALCVLAISMPVAATVLSAPSSPPSRERSLACVLGPIALSLVLSVLVVLLG